MDPKSAAVVAVVIILGVGGFWYFKQKDESPAVQQQTQQVTPGQPTQQAPVDPYSNYAAPSK